MSSKRKILDGIEKIMLRKVIIIQRDKYLEMREYFK